MRFFIGIIIGIIIAGGVAYYLNKAQSPFVTHETNILSQPLNQMKTSSEPLVLAPSMKKMASMPAKIEASTPQSYNFYDILQNNQSLSDNSESNTKQMFYFVQVGAYLNEDLANNNKAKLALLGYSSKIQTEQINDKIINRLLVGPFRDQTNASQTAKILADQGISTTIIESHS